MNDPDIAAFLKYYQRIRERTKRIITYIPEDKIDWTYRSGKFTLGDLVRHIACIERDMYAENAAFRPSRYQGCGKDLADGYQAVVEFMDRYYGESMAIFSSLTNEDLMKKTTTPGGIQITLWKWLRAMVEHEVHHRGQIYLYLNLLEVKTPPLFGLTAEEVEDRSQKS